MEQKTSNLQQNEAMPHDTLLCGVINQKVIDSKTKRVLGVEHYENGKWTWYYNELNGSRLDRKEGEGRILANFPINYVPFNAT